MSIFFILFGIVAGFCTNSEKSTGFNIGMAIITVGCFSCATALTILKP